MSGAPPTTNDETNVAEPPGHRMSPGPDEPLHLDCGVDLKDYTIAYQTYGRLNDDKSNAILICHALTMDHFAADVHPITGKAGWWTEGIGPGLAMDTDRYFVICSNVIGSCMGSTGPTSTNPDTGKPYGIDFPVITIADMVRAQVRLIDELGIDKLFSVIGGSVGGMQVLEWATSYPDRVFSAVPIACAAAQSAQNIAFYEVGRQAIMADPDWRGGRYLEAGVNPDRGLSVARMAAHITYLSEAALHVKFGRRLQDRAAKTFGFDADFQVESYLRHQGSAFVNRFDANSYLYVSRAMDYFDLAGDRGCALPEVFKDTSVRFCVISFTSDWHYPTSECRQIVKALNAAAANVSFAEIETDAGHDAFLLDEPEFYKVLGGFLTGAARHRGLGKRRTAT